MTAENDLKGTSKYQLPDINIDLGTGATAAGHTSTVENTKTFLDKFPRTSHLKGFKNTWRHFCSLYMAYARVEDNLPPYPGRTKLPEIDHPVDQAMLRTIMEIRVCTALVNQVIPRVTQEGGEQSATSLEKRIPRWLRHKHGEKNKSAYEIFIEEGSKKKSKEFDFEDFNKISEIFLNQLESEKLMGSSSTKRTLVSLLHLNQLSYRFTRKDYALADDHATTIIINYLDKYFSYMTDKIGALDDERHDEVRQMIEKFGQYYKNPLSFYGHFAYRLHTSRSYDVIFGRLGVFRAIRQYALASNDPWYVNLDLELTNYLKGASRSRYLFAQQIHDAILPQTVDPDIDRKLIPVCEKFLQHNDSKLIFLNSDDSNNFFGNMQESYSTIYQNDGFIRFYISPRIISDSETDDMVTGFVFTIEPESGRVNSYLQILDDDNPIVPQLHSDLKQIGLFILNKAVEELDQRETSTTEETSQATISPIEVHTKKQKGKAHTPAAAHKRKPMPSINIPIPPSDLSTFTAELLDIKNRYQLNWDNQLLLNIQQDRRYTDDLMRQFLKKILVFNQGGAIQRTLIQIPGPTGGQAIEIKTGAYRILAELDEGNTARIYDIVPRKDLFKELSNS